MDIKEVMDRYYNDDMTKGLTAYDIPTLVSEVERLEKEKMEMQVTIEDCKYELNKKWEDHAKLVSGLKDAIKNGNQKIDLLEKENAALREVAKAAKSVEAQFGGQLDQFGNAALDALDLALNNAKDILETNNE